MRSAAARVVSPALEALPGEEVQREGDERARAPGGEAGRERVGELAQPASDGARAARRAGDRRARRTRAVIGALSRYQGYRARSTARRRRDGSARANARGEVGRRVLRSQWAGRRGAAVRSGKWL